MNSSRRSENGCLKILLKRLRENKDGAEGRADGRDGMKTMRMFVNVFNSSMFLGYICKIIMPISNVKCTVFAVSSARSLIKHHPIPK